MDDIDLAYAERDRNALHWYRYEGTRAMLPVMTPVCWECHRVVDLRDEQGYTVSRIGGDSRYGYEPHHAVH